MLRTKEIHIVTSQDVTPSAATADVCVRIVATYGATEPVGLCIDLCPADRMAGELLSASHLVVSHLTDRLAD